MLLTQLFFGAVLKSLFGVKIKTLNEAKKGSAVIRGFYYAYILSDHRLDIRLLKITFQLASESSKLSRK